MRDKSDTIVAICMFIVSILMCITIYFNVQTIRINKRITRIANEISDNAPVPDTVFSGGVDSSTDTIDIPGEVWATGTADVEVGEIHLEKGETIKAASEVILFDKDGNIESYSTGSIDIGTDWGE